MKGILLLVGLMMVGSAWAEFNCKDAFRYHKERCENSAATCDIYKQCSIQRSRCNIKLENQEQCESFDQCINDLRETSILSLGVDRTTQELLRNKQRCSYEWDQGGFCYLKKISGSDSVHKISCPGYKGVEFLQREKDFKFKCIAAKAFFLRLVKECEREISILDQRCPESEYKNLPRFKPKECKVVAISEPDSIISTTERRPGKDIEKTNAASKLPESSTSSY